MNVVANIVGGAATAAGERLTPKMWIGGICGCCDETQSCLDVVFCMPCQMSRQCAAIDEQKDTMDCGYCCCALVALYQGNIGAGFWASMLRYRMIEKYNIILSMEGAIMTSCFGFACFPCSLCQTNRTLMAIGENPMGTCCVPPVDPMAGFANPKLFTGGLIG